MVAYIPAENVAEVVVDAVWDGQSILSVMNFLFEEALSSSVLTDLAVTVITNWVADLAAEFSNQFTLNSVKATDLTTQDGSSAIAYATSGSSGTVNQRSVPLNVALVISEHTDQRGRSFRGRLYHPGIPITFTADAGSMVEANRAGAVAAYATFFGDIEDVMECQHVVLSRKHNGAWRTEAVATPIVSYSADSFLDSQRNRLVGRGS